jgi:hypothetical protein
MLASEAAKTFMRTNADLWALLSRRPVGILQRAMVSLFMRTTPRSDGNMLSSVDTTVVAVVDMQKRFDGSEEKLIDLLVRRRNSITEDDVVESMDQSVLQICLL